MGAIVHDEKEGEKKKKKEKVCRRRPDAARPVSCIACMLCSEIDMKGSHDYYGAIGRG